MADVAFLAGLDENTVCRLGDDPDCLDRVKGRSLQVLVGTYFRVVDRYQLRLGSVWPRSGQLLVVRQVPIDLVLVVSSMSGSLASWARTKRTAC